MEVSFSSRAGIADDAIFSIRAGTVKRQAPANANKAFRFPRAAKAEQQDNLLKFDLLTRVGTGYIVLKPFDTKYKVDFNDTSTCEVEVKWSKGDEPGSLAAANNNALEAEDVPAKPGAARDAQEYLDKHGILNFVQAMIQAVVKERLTDPYAYMGKQFLNGYDAVQPPPSSKPAPPPPLAAQQPQASSKAAGGDEALSKVPQLAESEELRTKIRNTLERSCSNGSLGRVVTEVAAELEGSQSAKQALTESEPTPKRELQTIAMKALQEGHRNGKLEEALLAVKKETGGQLQAIRLRVRAAVEQGQRDGTLETWLQAEIASAARQRGQTQQQPAAATASGTGGAVTAPTASAAGGPLDAAAQAEAAKKIQSLSRGMGARKQVAEKKQQQQGAAAVVT